MIILSLLIVTIAMPLKSYSYVTWGRLGSLILFCSGILYLESNTSFNGFFQTTPVTSIIVSLLLIVGAVLSILKFISQSMRVPSIGIDRVISPTKSLGRKYYSTSSSSNHSRLWDYIGSTYVPTILWDWILVALLTMFLPLLLISLISGEFDFTWQILSFTLFNLLKVWSSLFAVRVVSLNQQLHTVRGIAFFQLFVCVAFYCYTFNFLAVPFITHYFFPVSSLTMVSYEEIGGVILSVFMLYTIVYRVYFRRSLALGNLFGFTIGRALVGGGMDGVDLGGEQIIQDEAQAGTNQTQAGANQELIDNRHIFTGLLDRAVTFGAAGAQAGAIIGTNSSVPAGDLIGAALGGLAGVGGAVIVTAMTNGPHSDIPDSGRPASPTDQEELVRYTRIDNAQARRQV